MKKLVLICFVCLIAGGGFIFLFNRHQKSKILAQYSEEARPSIKATKIKDYNKTLDVMASSSSYNKDHIDSYLEIEYVSPPDFPNKVETLLNKNYKPEEINKIFASLSETNVTKLLNKDYLDLNNFYQISNFDVDLYDEYIAYQKEKNLDWDKAVTYVNLHLNHNFYENIETVENPDDLLVLVNKFHALPADYEPDDLVNVGQYSYKMRKVAAESLEQLMAAAALENMNLIPFSTYRSYDYQKGLYEYYLQTDDVSVVDTYSARPGHSEHQTGLACDIRSSVLNDNLTDHDYQWMLDNSYKYGFIVRYPKGGSEITGYVEEPWHIRYIGVEHATKVHDLGITYDEYYDLYLKKS